MKIVIAPDSYKGSLSAKDVGSIVKIGFERELPNSDIDIIPIADGGEGTLDCLIYATKGKKEEIVATGPLMEKCKIRYGILGDEETVIIETASICGLTMVPIHQRNPVNASTYGIGEVIRHCMDKGYRKFLVGLGGSATNDGGLGMLQALGGKFLDSNDLPVAPIASSLTKIKKVDFGTLDQRVKEIEIKVACDVTNPLCGPNGASYVFGPQKGATIDQVKMLDRMLLHYSQLIEAHLDKNLRDIPGAGAAGGLGFAFLVLNSKILPGAQIVAEATALEEKIKEADLVITGEGQSDFQTLYGKAPIYVAKIAKKYNVKVILVSGGLGDGYEKLYDYFVSCHSITRGPILLEECIQNAGVLLLESSRNIARLIKHFNTSNM